VEDFLLHLDTAAALPKQEVSKTDSGVHLDIEMMATDSKSLSVPRFYFPFGKSVTVKQSSDWHVRESRKHKEADLCRPRLL
jgi:hypothetical protein